MAYDLTPTQRLLEVLKQRELTKAERAIAREQIGRYYAKKLAHLQQHLFEALEKTIRLPLRSEESRIPPKMQNLVAADPLSVGRGSVLEISNVFSDGKILLCHLKPF